MPQRLVYCLLLGALHQNIEEKAVKWQKRERKWNLLGVSRPYNWSLA